MVFKSGGYVDDEEGLGMRVWFGYADHEGVVMRVCFVSL